VDPQRVKSAMSYATPTNTSKVESVLGMVGYYQKFIENCSHLTSSITNIMGKPPILSGLSIVSNLFMI